MKKVFVLVIFLVSLLTACGSSNRTITFNIEDDYELIVLIGEDLDLNSITAYDQDDMNLSPFIEIEGTYDLETVGSYNVKAVVTDNFGAKGSVNIIITVIEKDCIEDSTQDKCIIPITNLEFTADTDLITELYVDDFIKLKYIITPLDATNQVITVTSSDTSIATVNDYGFVFGESEGVVTVTFETEDKSISITKTINIVEKTCDIDPLQEKCALAYIADDSRVITLADENVSGLDYTAVYVNNKIYYEIFVRKFADSDNDNIGDFQGIIDNLPYLKSIGVGGLWLMPIMPSNSDHGYDISDYYDVNSDYGTMLEFKELVSAAELIGIDIIIDLVINHMGAHNDIFQDVLKYGTSSDYYDWFTWIDSSDPRYGTTGSWGQNIWRSPFSNSYIKKTSFTVHSSLNGKYYAGYFSEWMPDLNFLNQDTIDYIDDVGAWWIEEVGVAGYRMDAIAHIFGYNEYLGVSDLHQANVDFLSDFNNHCALSDPDVYIVGEAWDSYQVYSRYYEAGISTFNFYAGDSIISAVNGYNNNLGYDLYDVYTEIEKYTTDYIDAPFLKNHDQDRIAKTLDDDIKTRMAAEALLFLPGSPYIYYGDEIGMLGTRTNFLWGTYYDSLFSNYEDRDVSSVSEQLAIPESLLNTYIELGDVRNNSLALSYGDYVPFTDVGLSGFYRVFENGYDKELVIVLFNFSSVYNRPIPQMFSSYEILYSSYDDNFGGISPKGTVVLRLPYELKATLID